MMRVFSIYMHEWVKAKMIAKGIENNPKIQDFKSIGRPIQAMCRPIQVMCRPV